MTIKPKDLLVVLIHGWAGRPTDWDIFLDGLRPRGLNVLNLVLPGHEDLDSRGAASPGLPSWEELISGLAKDLGSQDKPLLLMGYSMGGRVALALAERLGEKVLGVVALGAGLGTDEPDQRAKRLALDEIRARDLEANPKDFWESWYQQPLFLGGRRELPWSPSAERRHEQRGATLAKALVAYSPARHGSLRDAALHTKNLLYFYGELDSFYRTYALELAALRPEIRVREVRGAGHSLLREGPEKRGPGNIALAK